MTMPCIVPEQPLLLGLLHVHTTTGLDLVASIGGIVSCLFLVGACSGFYQFGWNVVSLFKRPQQTGIHNSCYWCVRSSKQPVQ